MHSKHFKINFVVFCFNLGKIATTEVTYKYHMQVEEEKADERGKTKPENSEPTSSGDNKSSTASVSSVQDPVEKTVEKADETSDEKQNE